VGELSRAIGRPWSALWLKVGKQEERKDIGKALSADEERRLLEAARNEKRWGTLAGTMIRVALLAGMRSGEITRLMWGQMYFEKRLLSVGRGKKRHPEPTRRSP
jgi:integrase